VDEPGFQVEIGSTGCVNRAMGVGVRNRSPKLTQGTKLVFEPRRPGRLKPE
jgi:hypothetical protein